MSFLRSKVKENNLKESKIHILRPLAHARTITIRSRVGHPFEVHPRLHAHEVRHEGRNHALKNGRVAPENRFVQHLRQVALCDHWGEGE